jgi:hypothetical protein
MLEEKARQLMADQVAYIFAVPTFIYHMSEGTCP